MKQDGPARRDDVERLLRLAGRRPVVPAPRAERVRHAVHAAWRSELQRRRRAGSGRRTAVLLAAAAVVVAVSLGIVRIVRHDPTGAGAAARLASLVGETLLHDGRQTRPLSAGAPIPAGSEISTARDGRAALRFTSGHSVRIDRNTRLRVVDRGTISLDDGAVYVDSGPDPRPAGSLHVVTPRGTVREIGTQYEVRVAGSSVTLRVREGTVVLRDGDTDHRVTTATELQLRPDGSVARREIARHGPAWEWTTAVVLLPEVDGMSAGAFLAWVARENGWKLRYADAALAASAERIVLGGSVRGLRAEQALQAVLPTCRMAHRIEDGILSIVPLADESTVD